MLPRLHRRYISLSEVEENVAQTAKDYVARAVECVRLANLSSDEMIRRELLQLRQTYLRIAEALGIPLSEAIAALPEPKNP